MLDALKVIVDLFLGRYNERVREHELEYKEAWAAYTKFTSTIDRMFAYCDVQLRLFNATHDIKAKKRIAAEFSRKVWDYEQDIGLAEIRIRELCFTEGKFPSAEQLLYRCTTIKDTCESIYSIPLPEQQKSIHAIKRDVAALTENIDRDLEDFRKNTPKLFGLFSLA